MTLQWHYNERDGVSNHRRLHCLLNCWFRQRVKENTKNPRRWPLCGNSPLTGEFPAQKQWGGKCFHLMTSKLSKQEFKHCDIYYTLLCNLSTTVVWSMVWTTVKVNIPFAPCPICSSIGSFISSCGQPERKICWSQRINRTAISYSETYIYDVG